MKKWFTAGLILALAWSGCGPAPRPQLRVGVEGCWPPLVEMCETSGRWEGIAADTVRLIADSLGLEVAWTAGTPDEMASALQTGTIDLLITVLPVAQPATDTAHSLPYLASGQVIVCDSSDRVPSLPELASVRVGVVDGRTGLAVATGLGVPRDHITVKNCGEQLLGRLLSGEVDVVIADREPVLVWQQAHPGLTHSSSAPFTLDLYCFSLHGGNQVLLERVNRVLDRMRTDGRQQEIEDRWLTSGQ